LPEQPAGAHEIGRRGRFVPIMGPSPGGLVAVITLVSLEEGIAIVPASVLDRICMPGVVYREIAGKPTQTGIAVACRRHEKSPAVKAFIKQITPR
jgi:DNA-binding transcriptional LysR family regulator